MPDGPLVCHRCGVLVRDASLGARCPRDQSALVPESEHLANRADMLLGRVLNEKYAMVGVIGIGGMGAVYRALQQPLAREVAVKVIRMSPESADEDAHVVQQRFFREAQIVARLTGPSLVRVYDYGAESDGLLYMVMELLRGQLLSDLLAAGALDPARAVNVTLGVLHALGEAHALGLVHRDLKPDNLMLVPGTWGEEQVKVLDFGLAKVLNPDEWIGVDHPNTATGLLAGTPHYMAPESEARRGDPRSDLYSLGVILYEMLTGRVPFDGPNLLATLGMHRNWKVPTLPRSISPALAEVVYRALAKKPDERFQDAGAMAAALTRAVGLPAAGIAAPGTPPKPPSRPLPEPIDGPPSGPITQVLPGTVPKRAPGESTAPEYELPLDREGILYDPEEAVPTNPTAKGPTTAVIQRPEPADIPTRVIVAASNAKHRGWLRRSARPALLVLFVAITVCAGLLLGRATWPSLRPRLYAWLDSAAPAPSADDSEAPAAVEPPPAETTPTAVAAVEAPGADAGAEDSGRAEVPEPAPPPSSPKSAGRGQGTVRVTCRPWCNVHVDGKEQGRASPAKKVALTAGTHRLRMSHPPSGKAVERTITVRSGGETKESAKF